MHVHIKDPLELLYLSLMLPWDWQSNPKIP